MKIVMIHGQNHTGSSCHIGRMIAEKIDVCRGEHSDVTEFFLPRDLHRFCLGCYRCIEGDENCPFYQEKNRIMQAVEQADILIFTTPVYCMRASAPMKTFMDLTFTYWMSHRPRACMFRKKAVVVATAAGAGAGSAVRDIANTLFYWGVPCVRTYGMTVQAMNWESVSEKKKKRIQKDTDSLARRLSGGKKPFVGLRTRFMFRMMAMMQAAGFGSSPYEKEYWNHNGWLGSKRPWK